MAKSKALMQQLQYEEEHARQEQDRAEQAAREAKLEYERAEHVARDAALELERAGQEHNDVESDTSSERNASVRTLRSLDGHKRLSTDTNFGDVTPPQMARMLSTDTVHDEPLPHIYRTPSGSASARLRSVAHAIGVSAHVIGNMTPAAHAAAERLGIDVSLSVPQTL